MAYLPDLPTTVERYLEAWNEPDPDARYSLVHASFATHGVYLDPSLDAPVQGQPQLAAYIALFRAQSEDRLEAAGPADAHHDTFRMPWRLVSVAGVVSTGLLVGTLDRDARLSRAVHFVDPEPVV